MCCPASCGSVCLCKFTLAVVLFFAVWSFLFLFSNKTLNGICIRELVSNPFSQGVCSAPKGFATSSQAAPTVSFCVIANSEFLGKVDFLWSLLDDYPNFLRILLSPCTASFLTSLPAVSHLHVCREGVLFPFLWRNPHNPEHSQQDNDWAALPACNYTFPTSSTCVRCAVKEQDFCTLCWKPELV